MIPDLSTLLNRWIAALGGAAVLIVLASWVNVYNHWKMRKHMEKIEKNTQIIIKNMEVGHETELQHTRAQVASEQRKTE